MSELKKVEASWDERYPVNFEFIGVVTYDTDDPPEFVMIGDKLYERCEFT